MNDVVRKILERAGVIEALAERGEIVVEEEKVGVADRVFLAGGGLLPS